ncbi:septum formation initiator [Bifidobacterium goeldii]|uniref:Septum formation initiator n=1 Tax=Bifidobacterium goeldii TaxID=2306975 RepID=A0A430FM74_9BIFI|nr:septum formation initiator [Bifidobacterium goeldii]
MSMNRNTRQRKKTGKRGRSAGPIAFFVSLFIVALGAIQMVSTFHTYALNLAELNGLKKQEAALVAKKQDLENDIARWNDDSYVAAQARERLGFVFPGEQSVRVEHPEAVTGGSQSSTSSSGTSSDKKALPWYSELAYAFKKADADPATTSTDSSDASSSSKNSSSDSNTNTTDTKTDTNTTTGKE